MAKDNKEKKEKLEIKIFYTNYEKQILDLKEAILADFKSFMKENFDVVFIAEWIDCRYSSIYNDKFLVRKDGNLYTLNMSSTENSILVNGHCFRRFDTINFNRVRSYNDYYGYNIDANGVCINTNNKNKHPRLYSAAFKYVYRDLLRKNKIKNLLDEESNKC